MPRGSPAAITAALSFLGLALVVAGAVILTQHDKGLGLALAAAGFVALFFSGRLAPTGRGDDGRDRPSREA